MSRPPVRITTFPLLAASTLCVCLGLTACDRDPIDPHGVLQPFESFLSEPVQLEVNPTGISPLTAIATIRTTQRTSVGIRLLGPDSLSYEAHSPATEHSVPVLGLYPAAENRVEVRITNGAGDYGLDTLSVITGNIPDHLPSIDILTADQQRMEPGWTLASFSIGVGGTYRSHPFMFDAGGRIRWYLDLSAFHGLVYMVERLKNGNLVFGFAQSVYEYDMLGREVNRWNFPGYDFHHDVVEKPDGNLIVAVSKHGTGTVEDHVIELHRKTGTIVREWDLRQVLDVRRRVPPGYADWFHMNSVWFDERDGSIIVSGRHQGVAKLTSDNRLVWILAPHAFWGRAGVDSMGVNTSEFLLRAVDAGGSPFPAGVQHGSERTPNFDWPWGQHTAMVLPNGNLFLFDNGDGRNFGATPIFSRGVEYTIDESKRQVKQVWAYGEARGAEYYAPIISDVDYLPKTGNRLIAPGIIFDKAPRAYVTEVAHPGGTVVFEAKLSFKNRSSSGRFEWGEFDLMYRAERLTPYP